MVDYIPIILTLKLENLKAEEAWAIYDKNLIQKTKINKCKNEELCYTLSQFRKEQLMMVSALGDCILATLGISGTGFRHCETQDDLTASCLNLLNGGITFCFDRLWFPFTAFTSLK